MMKIFQYLLFAVLVPVIIICLSQDIFASEEKLKAIESNNSIISQLTSQLEKLKNKNDQFRIFIQRGEAYRELGHLRDAKVDLEKALVIAKINKNILQITIANYTLGYIYFLKQDYQKGQKLLENAFSSAKNLKTNGLTAACANRLASILVSQRNISKGAEYYNEALKHLNSSDPELEAIIYRNIARISDPGEECISALKKARQLTEKINSNSVRAGLLLSIGVEAKQKWLDSQGVEFSFQVINQAKVLAEGLKISRVSALANLHLAMLYEDKGRNDKAMSITLQALEAVNNTSQHDILLQIEWQLGRLFQAKNELKRAVESYRMAVKHIQSIRQDIPITYQDGRSSFRATLAPIYSGLADALLTAAKEEKDPMVRQKLLREARVTMEKIKVSELRDYMQSPCLAAFDRKIESLAATTAVIYPIILSERLEILVDIQGKMFRASTKVSKAVLNKTTQSLASRLRDGMPFKELSHQVHQWLVAPVEHFLKENSVELVVFVPDGVLAILPIASLWDGKEFLIKKYAVATVPGLTLFDPSAHKTKEIRTLLAGMSEPGPVVSALPPRVMASLQETMASSETNRGVRGMVLQDIKSQNNSSSGQGSKNQKKYSSEDIKKLLALPGVAMEIEQLADNTRGETLMDKTFTLNKFENELENSSFQVIHIATHGFFGGTPEENFIMTYDKVLNMNSLEALLLPKKFDNNPVELIVFSACQTAEGDERSPMGLSGVALKSGARSAMGSLWPVSDLATQKLLPEFYKHLQNQNLTKAEALRLAQVTIMEQQEYQHPFFWAPFILVGNWQ
jgi:CHAT domain-containing protein/Tfp pilus assembly protein PilF